MTTLTKGPTRRDADLYGRDVLLSGSDWSRTVHWFDATYLATPAFWIEQARQRPRPETYQVGSTLLEEVALCLLGGHGITEQMAYVSFARLRAEGLLTGAPQSVTTLHAALARPFDLPGRPRPVRYRFPMLKAERLSAAIDVLATTTPPSRDEPRVLRDWLLRLPGVGAKTASWVLRNLTRSDDIAVIDIHIRRAGVVAGVFDPAWKLPKDYRRFEEAFVEWARVGGVPTADLDACIWASLAELGRHARVVLGVNTLSDLD
ncbi:hypothetical protein [Cellulomonas cellasea]|uniref:Thermostable 8-oxoguanine DNA glycosylase n=1 Tax=Cellulomonas cellasea TaxID=43670 RepID=A0A7W4YD22_9CELL|nr:hypothetical protein [Cellulomonas cellasea]MBB2924116.1 thermostable 8-oxoguanine DNA glycosylase [Cellulomonas cellasea]